MATIGLIMNRFVIRISAAFLTFSLGLFTHAAYRQSHQQPDVRAVLPLEVVAASTDFEPTGITDMFMEDYRRQSDGALARFGCSDRASVDAAFAIVRNKREARLVEKTAMLDAKGVKIGERVVWDATSDSNEAVIRWNKGARLFSVHAPSLPEALAFEESKVWLSAGCWDARSW